MKHQKETYDGGTLQEVLIVPQYKATLDTYYPIVSKYPLTGHSSLKLSEAEKDNGLYTGKYKGIGRIDLGGQSSKYNLVTNNCSDATGKCLSEVFGIPMDTFLFTTPGDVRDYFIDRGAKEDLSRRKNIKRRKKIPKTSKGYDTHTKYLSPEQGDKMKNYLITNQGIDNGVIVFKRFLNELQ